MLPFSKTVIGKVFCCKISGFCKGVKPKDDEGPAMVSCGSRLWGQTIFTLQWPAVSLRAFWIYNAEGLQRERGTSVLLGQNVCFWRGRSLIQERQSGIKDRIISLFNAVVILTSWNHTSSEISICLEKKIHTWFLVLHEMQSWKTQTICLPTKVWFLGDSDACVYISDCRSIVSHHNAVYIISLLLSCVSIRLRWQCLMQELLFLSCLPLLFQVWYL